MGTYKHVSPLEPGISRTGVSGQLDIGSVTSRSKQVSTVILDPYGTSAHGQAKHPALQDPTGSYSVPGAASGKLVVTT